MMWLTAFFFFVEIIVGYVTNSMALVADSFHMLGDIAALVISFLSVKVSVLIDMQTYICIIYLICFPMLYCRCHQRSGQRTLLAGHALRYWVPWWMLSFWWRSASASPSRHAKGETPVNVLWVCVCCMCVCVNCHSTPCKQFALSPFLLSKSFFFAFSIVFIYCHSLRLNLHAVCIFLFRLYDARASLHKCKT